MQDQGFTVLSTKAGRVFPRSPQDVGRDFTSVNDALRFAYEQSASDRPGPTLYIHSYPSPDAEQNVTFYAVTGYAYHEGCLPIAKVTAIGDPEPSGYPKLWLDVAKERGATDSPAGSGQYDAGELDRVGVAILNGCPACGATVSPGNSYQIAADNDYTYCRDCAGVIAGRE